MDMTWKNIFTNLVKKTNKEAMDWAVLSAMILFVLAVVVLKPLPTLVLVALFLWFEKDLKHMASRHTRL